MATKDPPSASHEPGKHWTTSKQKSASRPNGPGREDAQPTIWRTQPLLAAAARTSHRAWTPAGRLLPRARLWPSGPSEVPYWDAEPTTRNHEWHAIRTTDVSIWTTGPRRLWTAKSGLLWSTWPCASPWTAATSILWPTPGNLWTFIPPTGPSFTDSRPTRAARTPIPTISRCPRPSSESASV